MLRLQKSPLFDSRFVPHRNIYDREDDVACECIDRTNYSSVVVRLQRFLTTDMERRKKGIQKAFDSALKHPCLCNLKEVLIDEENCITISVSENARGISLQRFVDLCSTKAGYNESLEKILSTLLKLYEDLHVSNLDLVCLPLAHVIISLKNNNVANVESVKVRRPFLCKLDRNCPSTSPFDNSDLYPIFAYSIFADIVDKLKVAFGYGHEDEELNTAVDDEESETKTAIEDEYDETRTALEEDLELKTAIGEEDYELETAIDAEECETKTAIDDEYDETQTAIEEDYELETAIDAEESETKTAIENDDDETRTALEEDLELKTAIGEDPIDDSSHFDVINNVIVNVDALSLLPGNHETDDMFDSHSLVSNESDFDVIHSADTVEEPKAVFTTKDYGFNGLTIKLFDNDCCCCEFNDQFVTFNGMEEIGSSESRDNLPDIDILQKLASNIRVMYALTTSIVPKKNYLVAFTEEK
uniref:Uncharacterized protein n=1 Tax=Panagrolaimus sp. PS1159 TaxID=55785 RepID=A0AC35FJ58_9BILA